MTDTRQALNALFDAWASEPENAALFTGKMGSVAAPFYARLWAAGYRSALSAQPVAGAVAERERCARWIRDNYQDHPNIDSLCAAMIAAPQAAPAPEPSAPIDAFKLYAELRDLVAEAGAVDTLIGRPEVLRSRLSDLCKRVGQLTTDLPLGNAPAPDPSACKNCGGKGYIDAWTLDGEYNPTHCEDCDGARKPAASEPSAQGEPVARYKRITLCEGCEHCAYSTGGVYRCMLAGKDFAMAGRAHHPPTWCPLPVLASAPSTPPPAVEAVPLTDEQIDALPMDEFVSGVRRPSLRAFARAAVELARGIAPKAAQEKT